MKFFGAGILGMALFVQPPSAGAEGSASETLNPPRFEVAVQSGYLFGVFGNPDSYEIGPEFISGRIRWGVNDSDSWTRGYNWRLVPYISGGLGLGWIDSHPDMRGSQGQDFTFNILTGIGVSYEIDDRWKVDAGVLYQHLSNGGQTDPNPSLNLIGPQIGVSYSF